jgi:hypothetical protein
VHDDETAVRATQEALMRVLVRTADTHRAEGRYADAERLYRRALPLAEQVFGRQHPVAIGIRTELCRVMEAQPQAPDEQFL